eukprot:Clim_evm30s242 gene=Clim_evmTU30s242
MAPTKASALDARVGTLFQEVATRKDSKIYMDSLMDALWALYKELQVPALQKLQPVQMFCENYKDHYGRMLENRVGRRDFELLKVIGRGAFGEVHVVRHNENKKVYAMKLLNKAVMLQKSETALYWAERDILAFSNSHWTIGLHYAFHDEKFLYLCMEYMPGGDLVTLMCKFTFTEDWVRFYIAETICAINHIHEMGYVHRDVKPDNLLLDRTGHLRITDFGSAVKLDERGLIKSSAAVGTPDYISPEVLESQGAPIEYGREVDWWSVGIIMYEMYYGETPFYSDDLLGTYSNIMDHKNKLQFNDAEAEVKVSDVSKELIRALLCDRKVRLGHHGTADFKNHSFFTGIDWDRIRKMSPPIVPEVKSDDDTSNFDDFDDENESEEFLPAKGFAGNQLPFVGYTYIKNDTFSCGQANGTATVTPVSVPANGDALPQVTSQGSTSSLPDEEGVDWRAKYEAEAMAKMALEGEKRTAQRHLDRLQRQQDSSQKLFEELQSKNATLMKDHANADLELKKAKRTLESETQTRQQMEKRVKELQEELETAKPAGDDDGMTKEEVKDELEKTKEKLREEKAKGRNIFQEKTEAENRALDLESQKSDMKRKLDKAFKDQAAAVDSVKAMRSDIQKEKIRADELQAQLESMSGELDSAQKAATITSVESHEQVQELQSDLDRLRKELSTSKAAARASENEKHSLEEEIGDLRQRVRSVEDEMAENSAAAADTLRKVQDDLAKAKAGNADELEKLRKEVSVLEAVRDAEREKAAVVPDLEKKLSNLEKEITSLTADRDAKVADFNATIDKMESEMSNKDIVVDNLQSSIRNLESDKDELKAEIEDVEAARETLQVELDTMKKSLEDAQAEMSELRSKFKIEKEKQQQSVRKIAELAAVRPLNRDTLKQAKELKTLKYEIKTVQMALNRSEKERNDLKMMADAAQTEASDYKKRYEALKHQIVESAKRLGPPGLRESGEVSRGGGSSMSLLMPPSKSCSQDIDAGSSNGNVYISEASDLDMNMNMRSLAVSVENIDGSNRLEDWVKLPKGKSKNKSSWKKFYAVATNRSLMIFDDLDHKTAHKPTQIIDIQDIVFVREATRIDLIHINKTAVEKIILILFSKKSGQTRNLLTNGNDEKNALKVNGHVLNHVSKGLKSEWCKVCAEAIGITQSAYSCKLCSTTCHKKCSSGTPPCTGELETGTLYMMMRNADEKTRWMSFLENIGLMCSSVPNLATRSTVE